MTLTERERAGYSRELLTLKRPVSLDEVGDRIVMQDALVALTCLPQACADLVIVDPPYNKNKRFNEDCFSKASVEEYAAWADSWLRVLAEKMKPTASIYICSDWQSSSAIQNAASRYFTVRNRITWERDKGRGAKRNWKNCAEDIWFCTKSEGYTFNIEAVKLSRRVIAPYRGSDGAPRDWSETENGNFRLTHPSNLWTDITVPFWSMPENTDHPTQKPEKLIAKLMLASSRPGDVVLDPFAGSGTTAVVAKKTGRRFIAIEMDELYCCLAQKRLHLAKADDTIQGYADGVFWERNTLSAQKQTILRPRRGGKKERQTALFLAQPQSDQL
jgi:site-specific DNA-methyltransferase (adenine-specific)